MPAAPSVPTLNLDEIAGICRNLEETGPRYCHVFGILLQEDLVGDRLHWYLSDETCLKGLKIKLCGNADSYPKPKHGDVVRIHRLTFDANIPLPIVANARNVVFWSSFVMSPMPVSSARNPTLTSEDETRRRILETFHCSTITRIKEIKIPENKDCNSAPAFDVAGRLEDRFPDIYGHSTLILNDGTGTVEVRVFAKQKPIDCVDHYEMAMERQLGDFIVVYGVKLANRVSDKIRLNLSANKKDGRLIRLVERDSILGVLLGQYLNPKPSSQTSNASQNSLEVSRRRSARLNSSQTSNDVVDLSQSYNEAIQQKETYESNMPTYTKLSDIIMTSGQFQFYDIAGQVRGRPQETSSYGNWIFQLYDGTKPQYGSYFVDQVAEPVADCVCILVYSRQNPRDTDQHIMAVKNLNEGDLVLVKNVKVSFREGRVRFEMNANLAFGKSINVIDKDSNFGSFLMDIVTNPDVDELREEFIPSSQPDDFVVVDD